MRARLIDWAGKAALALASLIGVFLVLEHVVFRFILVPDDVLPNVTINGVVRYLPNTAATFRHPDGRQTKVTINADGWNTTRQSYARERTPGRVRVAVIGDSYVHGTFVDVDKGFPHVIERELIRAGRDVEVYRFGMDGAPLSQYLNMLRREVVAFRPDVVVVPLIHNDFDESYRLLKTRYASSFMKLTTDESGRVIEIPPADFKPGFADVMRNFRWFRYLYYKTNLYLHLKGLVSRLFWGGNEDWSPEFISSAVDIRRINDHPTNGFFARYVMREMQSIAEREGFTLLFAMDGVREAIYEGRDMMDFEVGRLNRIAREVTAELGLPFIDLHEVFARAYERQATRFEFPYDWHWNERANSLVGEAIAQELLARDLLRPARPRAAIAGNRAPISVTR
jgi:hypothetical protein